MDNTYNIDFIARCIAGHNKTAIKSITTELENVQKQVGTNKNNISLLANNGGGYNFAKIGANSYNYHGITVTVSNGEITLSGTANLKFSLYLSGKITGSLGDDNRLTSQLPTQIAFTGAPDTDNDNRLIFGLYNDTTWVYSGSTNDLYHDLSGKTYNNWLIYLPIVSGKTYNGIWRPMIIDKTVYDSGFTNYQPYAMSNAELTAAIQAIQAQLENVQKQVGDVSLVKITQEDFDALTDKDLSTIYLVSNGDKITLYIGGGRVGTSTSGLMKMKSLDVQHSRQGVTTFRNFE